MGIFSVVLFFFLKQLLASWQTTSGLLQFVPFQMAMWKVRKLIVVFLFQQERTRPFDGFSMHSLENSLIDIMRAEQDSLKGLFLH